MIHIAFLLILTALIISGHLWYALLFLEVSIALFIAIKIRIKLTPQTNGWISFILKLAGDWVVALSVASFIMAIHWFIIKEKFYSFLSIFKDERSLFLASIIMILILSARTIYYFYNKFFGYSIRWPKCFKRKNESQNNNSRTLGKDLSGE
ncbi:MAG: hypothetical protein IJV75_02925 [Alphaproteobacteria bacterium]|nr:hypothetical protein [Alphaproteobacteria bacterium]